MAFGLLPRNLLSCLTGRKRSNFFVVSRGRDVGVKYRWCDVLSTVAGHPNPAFKGYDNLAVAKRAFAALSLSYLTMLLRLRVFEALQSWSM